MANKIDQELIFDQIKELFNLGVGIASKELGELVSEEVILKVPSANLYPRHRTQEILGVPDGQNITWIGQQFSGEVTGQAILVFQEEKSLALVRNLLGEDSSLAQMSELDDEALTDVSSIIVNGVLAAITGTLSLDISSSMPDCMHGTWEILYNRFLKGDPDEDVLYVTVSFLLKESEINGKIIFIQEMNHAQIFFNYINDYIKKSLFF